MSSRLPLAGRLSACLTLLAALPVAAQPVLVADVNPGAADGSVTELAAFDGDIYFSGKAQGGTELWHYDPDSDTAERLTNLQAQSLKPDNLTGLGGILYFNGTDDAHGRELWRYDPSTNEADLVVDILPGPDPSTPNFLAAFDGDLYFRAFTLESKKELWRYDPDTDTAVQTPEIRDPESAAPADLTPLGDFLYFRAFEDATGDELWRHDPATNTNTLVVDIVPGPPIGEPRHLTVFDGRLYFFAKSPEGGPWNTLWRYDPATDTATKLADIPAGTGEDWMPEGMVAVDGSLYFFAGSPDGADDLWRHQISNGGVGLVADLPPGNDDRRPLPLAEIGGVLLFAASIDDAGRELWQFDSGSGAISLAGDLNPGPGSSDPLFPAVLNGALYFSADDGANGRELWRYDPPPVPSEAAPEASGVSEIAPNPSRRSARLGVTLEAPGEVRVTVLDVLGREVARAQAALSAGAHHVAVPVEGLTPGAYVVRVEVPGGVATRRVTLAR